MKKVLLILGLFATTIINSQTQRVILYEEFTGENCGPCASTNPGLNQLLHTAGNYGAKIVSVKYQVPIPTAPGANSLYGQNISESNTRRTYYSVPFAPYARFNGNIELPHPTNSSNDGIAGLLTQTYIDDSSGVLNSPFSLVVNHSLNAAADSITVVCTVTAAQNFTPSGALKLQVSLQEFEINLDAATGTNGEKDFRDVMRKMLPNASGTTLTTGAWTNGQTQTITLKAPLPSYLYDKSQIAIVAFVQTDGDKRVHQAALSEPQKLPFDIRLTKVDSVSLPVCSAVTPSVLFKNIGDSTITSLGIRFKLNNGIYDTIYWNGTLVSGDSAFLTLPAITPAVGTNTVFATAIDPNNLTDVNMGNNTKSIKFKAFINSQNAPFVEPFPYGSNLPSDFTVIDPNPNDKIKWVLGVGFGGFLPSSSSSTEACAALPLIRGDQSAIGNKEELLLEPIDLSGGTIASMSFDVASAPFAGGENDMLEVLVSNNCGQSWTTVFTKTGSVLNTAPATTSSFIPTATQWRKEQINLNSFSGTNNDEVYFKFVVTNDFGNNIFIDNINIANSGVGIEATSSVSSLSFYPNPASNNTTIKIGLLKEEDFDIAIYNSIGELVYSESKRNFSIGDHELALNTEGFANGLYTVAVKTSSGSISKKLIINK